MEPYAESLRPLMTPSTHPQCVVNNRKLYLYIDRETSFLTMYSLLGSLDNHGRRMTRSACGSSRHSAGAAGSRRQSFLKRRTLFLYASPTTVSGAFTPSNRRVAAPGLPEAEDVVLVGVADDR